MSMGDLIDLKRTDIKSQNTPGNLRFYKEAPWHPFEKNYEKSKTW
jgi:hypothetical protein